MRILLVTDAYPPEIGSAAVMMAELAQELSRRGHTVRVLTTWPSYKLAREEKLAGLSEEVFEHRVQVLRIKTMPIHNVGFLLRGLGTLISPYQLWAGLRRHGGTTVDATFVYSPPIAFSFIGMWLKRRGAKFVLNVQDIFPQNAIDLGVMRNPVFIALFRWIERRAYSIADVVTAHSQGNLKQLVAAHPKLAGRMTLLHNWTADDVAVGGALAEDFRTEYGLRDKFVGVYGGVIGPAQGLDIAIEVAQRLRDLKDLVFLLVGDGTEKKQLEEQARSLGLTNVIFKHFVSQNRFPSLLHSFDFGLLTLSPKMKTPVVPGKLLSYMSASLPVVALVNRESDAHSIVADAHCGYSCNSDCPDEAALIVRRIYEERPSLSTIGGRGRAYLLRHFQKETIISEVETLLS